LTGKRINFKQIEEDRCKSQYELLQTRPRKPQIPNLGHITRRPQASMHKKPIKDHVTTLANNLYAVLLEKNPDCI